MKLGFVSDGLGALALPEMLDQALRLGADGVELSTGGWSGAPHCDLGTLLHSAAARSALRAEFDTRGLDLIALNVPGNPLHPVDRAQGDCLADTIRLAGALGVGTVSTMSGLPAGSPTEQTPCWIVTPWPPEVYETLSYQWEDVLLPFWAGISALARENGVSRIALEMHGHQCVHNVSGLMRLRDEVGPSLGATLNPAQQFWMGGDPIAIVGHLREALFHVHARDTMTNATAQAVSTCLDTLCSTDIPARSWTHVTPGIGHDAGWWRRFCYHLRIAGYDGWLSLDHTDPLLGPVETLERSFDLLRRVMPLPVPEEGARAV